MPSSRIGKYISILNRQSQKYLHHLVEQYGIGYSSYYFVMYIGANPKCSQREMCDSMAMDQAMATREMRRLEKSGYIIREKRPGNAKTYEISLSESGEKLYLKLKDKLTEWWGELLVESKIDPEPFSEQLKTLAKSACEKTAGMGNQEKRTEKTR
nr:MarR family winged helix-turn-helix transcriptional regulator [uncultured Sellimonas sp.]